MRFNSTTKEFYGSIRGEIEIILQMFHVKHWKFELRFARCMLALK